MVMLMLAPLGDRMTAVHDALPLGLDRAISAEDGRQLLVRDSGAISAETETVLRDAATAMAQAGDQPGVDDLTDWAEHARALFAWRSLLSRAPSSRAELTTMVAAAAPDDRFFDIGIDMIESALAVYGGAHAAATPDPAAAAEALEAAVTQAGMLRLIADETGDHGHQVRAAYATGRTLTVPSVHAERNGGPRDEVSLATARSYFERCASEQAAPIRQRFESLRDLAWIAGPGKPEEVAGYQASAEELLTAAPKPDLDALRAIRRDRAWWAAKRGDNVEALRLHELNLADTERELFASLAHNYSALVVRDCEPDYVGAIGACLQLAASHPDPARAARTLELSEAGKARAFAHGLATGVAQPASSPFLLRRTNRITAELDRLGALLPELRAESAEAAKAPGLRLQQLIDAYGRNEQRRLARALVVRDLRLLQPRTADQIRELVPPGGAYVSYHWSPGRVVISVVREDGLAGRPVTIDIPLDDLAPDKVARAAFFLQFAIYSRGNYTSSDTIQQIFGERMEAFWPDQFQRYLHDQLIEPVADRIADASALVISPPSRLRTVPFHALLDADGSALSDRHAIAYTNGALMLAACRQRRRTELRTCFAAGTSVAKGGPAAAVGEAAAVAAAFGAQPATATAAAVLADGTRADVLHLASHINETALSARFGLVLDDGVLPQSQIAVTPFAASLVTLSACQGAAADVDPGVTDAEMTGLVGAFLRAGVPLVAATLWALSDRVARPFVERFYAALTRPGGTAAQALREAQRAVKSDSRFSHPYYWAPFTLWGDANAPFDGAR